MSYAPPSDNPAEQAVLGALLAGLPVVDDLGDMLQGRDFYRPAHEAVWDACMAAYQAGDRVDPIVVAQRLGGELQRIGGAPYLHTLMSEGSATPAQALRHAEAVLDKALRRRGLEATQRSQQHLLEAEDAAQALQDAQQAMADAASQARTAEAGASIGGAMDDALEWLEHPPEGAPTPWVDVNERTNGLRPGAMVTVAARPGGGKSLVAKDVGVFTAKQGLPVHIATLEMSRNEYMARILAAEARVDLGKMLRQQMSDGEWSRVSEASTQLRHLPLYLDDRERQTMAQIRASARQTQRRYGRDLGLIAIDYCQLVQPADRRQPREQQVAQISRDTKLLAKEFGCPVLLLAQLNRRGSERSDPTPVVTDLRESGALEQDSDQVWLLHRPDMHGDEERLGEVDLIVGKNRNGPAPLTVTLAFQGHYARIVSMV